MKRQALARETILRGKALVVGILACCGGGLASPIVTCAGTNQWTQVGPGGSTILDLEVSDSGELWVGTDSSGLFMSSDAGMTWTAQPGVDPRSCLGIEQSPHDTGKWLALGPGGVFLRQSGLWSRVLGMEQADQFHGACFGHGTSTILVATTRGLFRSTNLGQSWARVASAFGKTEIYYVARNPLRDSEIWVGTREGLYKSSDDGATFVVKSAGLGQLPHAIITSIAISSWSADVLWVGTWYGVYESADGGENWQIASAIPKAPVRAVAVGPLGSGSPATAGPVVAILADAAYLRSTTVGTWTSVRSGSFGSAVVGASSWILGRADGVLEISTDAGANWAVHGTRVGQPDVLSLAFNGQSGYGVFDFGAYAKHAIYKTTDGTTWTACGPLPAGVEPLTVSLDPAGIAFAGSVEDGKRGIVMSADGGLTWAHIAPPTAVMGVTLRVMHLAPSPNNPSFIVVGVMAGESSSYSTDVYKATTPWSAWTGITPSVGGWPAVWTTALATRGTNEIWMGSLNGHKTPILLKSANGGTAWAQVGQGIIAEGVTGLALDSQPGLTGVWISTDGQGVLKTVDQGMTFVAQNVGLPDVHVHTIVKAQLCPTLFCATEAGALTCTTNGGGSWSTFAPTVPFARANVLACSADGKTLLVGSVGEGLWHYMVSP